MKTAMGRHQRTDKRGLESERFVSFRRFCPRRRFLCWGIMTALHQFRPIFIDLGCQVFLWDLGTAWTG